MILEFAFVRFKKGTEVLKGVILKDELANIQPGIFTCTSHCEIVINGKKYTVLWKLVPEKATSRRSVSSGSDPSVSNTLPDDYRLEDSEDLVQPIEDIDHCLPFKVLGTCHTVDRQNVLERAFTYLEEHNRHVFAKIEAEPDNPYDKHAIAVYVMSSSDYEKVGYIAKELTQYVHPVLYDKSLDVSVKKIRFCTTYCMVGYYLTINISKKGLWDKQVISASKRVN